MYTGRKVPLCIIGRPNNNRDVARCVLLLPLRTHTQTHSIDTNTSSAQTEHPRRPSLTLRTIRWHTIAYFRGGARDIPCIARVATPWAYNKFTNNGPNNFRRHRAPQPVSLAPVPQRCLILSGNWALALSQPLPSRPSAEHFLVGLIFSWVVCTIL